MLDLLDEFKYAARVARNVKVGPIKVLELHDSSQFRGFKAGVCELEDTPDCRPRVTARAGFGGCRRSFRHGREERVTRYPAIRLLVLLGGTADFEHLQAEWPKVLAGPVVATLDRCSLDLASEHDNDVYILFPY